MDFKMVLDSGIVIEYMKKYVNKFETMTKHSAVRIMGSFYRTVTDEG